MVLRVFESDGFHVPSQTSPTETQRLNSQKQHTPFYSLLPDNNCQQEGSYRYNQGVVIE